MDELKPEAAWKRQKYRHKYEWLRGCYLMNGKSWVAKITRGDRPQYLGCSPLVVGAAQIYNDHVIRKGMDLPLNDLDEVARQAAALGLDVPLSELQLTALSAYLHPIQITGNYYKRRHYAAFHKRGLVAVTTLDNGNFEMRLTEAGRNLLRR